MSRQLATNAVISLKLIQLATLRRSRLFVFESKLWLSITQTFRSVTRSLPDSSMLEIGGRRSDILIFCNNRNKELLLKLIHHFTVGLDLKYGSYVHIGYWTLVSTPKQNNIIIVKYCDRLIIPNELKLQGIKY